MIDWLLQSDIHFIICHLHQHTMPEWDATELITQYKRLESHNGFPTAENLRCPVFTQNKLKYLELIDQQHINNTFAIPLANYSAYKNLGPMYTRSIQQGLITLPALNNGAALDYKLNSINIESKRSTSRLR